MSKTSFGYIVRYRLHRVHGKIIHNQIFALGVRLTCVKNAACLIYDGAITSEQSLVSQVIKSGAVERQASREPRSLSVIYLLKEPYSPNGLLRRDVMLSERGCRLKIGAANR